MNEHYDWDDFTGAPIRMPQPRPLPTVNGPATRGQLVATVAIFASLLCVPLSVVLLGLGVVDWAGALAILAVAPLGLFCTTLAVAVIVMLAKERVR